jgi:hypothetical protein
LVFLSAALFFYGCGPAADDDDASNDDDAADDDDSSDDDDSADDDDSSDDDDDSGVDDDDSAPSDDDDASSDDDDSASSAAISLDLCELDPPAQDAFDLGSTSITGDVLSAEVSYSGGCEVHEFSACWNGMFRTSLPMQVTVAIGHNANGDTCEAYLTETLVIDLTDIRTNWEQGNSAPGTIMLHVGDQVIPWSIL